MTIASPVNVAKNMKNELKALFFPIAPCFGAVVVAVLSSLQEQDGAVAGAVGVGLGVRLLEPTAGEGAGA